MTALAAAAAIGVPLARFHELRNQRGTDAERIMPTTGGTTRDQDWSQRDVERLAVVNAANEWPMTRAQRRKLFDALGNTSPEWFRFPMWVMVGPGFIRICEGNLCPEPDLRGAIVVAAHVVVGEVRRRQGA